jgi:hypothetical protein
LQRLCGRFERVGRECHCCAFCLRQGRLGNASPAIADQTWVDTSFIDQVLKEEKLEGYWPARPVL